MKGIKKFFVLLLVLCNCLLLSACGTNSGNSGLLEQSDYKVRSLNLDNTWNIDIYDDKIIYDEVEKCDNLVIYIKAKNISDKDCVFDNLANINAYQSDGEALLKCKIKDKNGSWIMSNKPAKEKTKSGDTIELVYGWRINGEKDVKVVFGGYASSVKKVESIFKIQGRTTDESKAVANVEKSLKEEKMKRREIELTGCKIDIPEGWYLYSNTKFNAKLKRVDKDKGYVDVSCMSNTKSAREWIETVSSSFSNKFKTDSFNVNGHTYHHIAPSDSQVMLYADRTDEEKSVIKVNGMYVDIVEVKDVLKGVIIK